MTEQTQGTESADGERDELESELGRTRDRVSADVEALGEKLSPSNLKAEAKRAVKGGVRRGVERLREGVDGAEASVLGFCRDNPIPLSLIGAGIGWLIYNSRKNRQAEHAGPDHAVVGRSAVYDESGGAEATRSDRLGQLKQGVHDGVERVERFAESTAHRARTKFDELEQTARDQAQHARRAADRALEEQPLVLGAVALGAGLALGLALPSTESENKLVGQYRDRLVSKAKSRIGELGGAAERAAEAGQEALKQERSGEKSAAE